MKVTREEVEIIFMISLRILLFGGGLYVSLVWYGLVLVGDFFLDGMVLVG